MSDSPTRSAPSSSQKPSGSGSRTSEGRSRHQGGDQKRRSHHKQHRGNSRGRNGRGGSRDSDRGRSRSAARREPREDGSEGEGKSEGGEKKEIEYETDPVVLERRKKQISYGKNTLAYDNYVEQIPKDKRAYNMPRTPPMDRKHSRRQWDGMVKAWKRAIQVGWDPNSENKVDNGQKKSVEEVARDWNDIIDEERAEEAARGERNDLEKSDPEHDLDPNFLPDDEQDSSETEIELEVIEERSSEAEANSEASGKVAAQSDPVVGGRVSVDLCRKTSSSP